MSDDLPVTGNPVIDGMTKVFDWLGRQVEQIVPRLPEPSPPAPSDMTDKQLHHAIHDVGARLLNDLGPVTQQTFARYGSAMSDARFRHGMPTTVRGHVLAMVTEATDAYAVSLLSLREHASAAALGATRIVAETLTWARWLLESPDDAIRSARALRLTLRGIEGYRKVGATLLTVAGKSAETTEFASQLAAAADRMRRSLNAMADEDGITIPANPGNMSALSEQFLHDHGGYLFYALLNSSGAHPGAARASQFYGTPGTGLADYDFKGRYDVRAYWIAQSIALHLDMCHLAAPVLDWQDWDAIASRTEGELRPLSEEAERRYAEPRRQALAKGRAQRS